MINHTHIHTSIVGDSAREGEWARQGDRQNEACAVLEIKDFSDPEIRWDLSLIVGEMLI